MGLRCGILLSRIIVELLTKEFNVIKRTYKDGSLVDHITVDEFKEKYVDDFNSMSLAIKHLKDGHQLQTCFVYFRYED